MELTLVSSKSSLTIKPTIGKEKLLSNTQKRRRSSSEHDIIKRRRTCAHFNCDHERSCSPPVTDLSKSTNVPNKQQASIGGSEATRASESHVFRLLSDEPIVDMSGEGNISESLIATGDKSDFRLSEIGDKLQDPLHSGPGITGRPSVRDKGSRECCRRMFLQQMILQMIGVHSTMEI